MKKVGSQKHHFIVISFIFLAMSILSFGIIIQPGYADGEPEFTPPVDTIPNDPPPAPVSPERFIPDAGRGISQLPDNLFRTPDITPGMFPQVPDNSPRTTDTPLLQELNLNNLIPQITPNDLGLYNYDLSPFPVYHLSTETTGGVNPGGVDRGGSNFPIIITYQPSAATTGEVNVPSVEINVFRQPPQPPTSGSLPSSN